MPSLPASVRPLLRRFARRLALGLFLDIWPRWAAASLLVAGLVALVCRMFFASVAPILSWLWIAPILTVAPALFLCRSAAYRPADVVALADSLSGGHGRLLTLLETGSPTSSWAEAPALASLASLPLPRLRPWRRIAPMLPAAAFLATALMMPQRLLTVPTGTALANDIAGDLNTTLVELKKQELLTPGEEKELAEAIERIRKSATERVDASSWEAADALREKVATDLSGKRDALKWAEDSVLGYAAAAQAGAPDAETQAGEMLKAIEKLAQAGLLVNAPGDLQNLLGGKDALAAGRAQLPADAAALRKLSESLSAYLAKRGERFGDLAKLGKEFGRFDPAEFPLESDASSPDGDGDPGRGGVNRGRADAQLTWGKETQSYDRFKSVALPPGGARSPDDWAPLAVLPGAPTPSPEASAPAIARAYAGAAGQAAWRRALAPRHHSAVKKYFEDSPAPGTK